MGLEEIELVIGLEDEFGISIPDVIAQEVRTIGQMYDVILPMVRSHGKEAIRHKSDLEAFVWDTLCRRAAKLASGIRPSEITRDTRFAGDLGYG